MCTALLRDLDEAAADGLGPDDWDVPIEYFPGELEDYEKCGWRCVAHTAQLCVMDVLDTTRGIAPERDLSMILNVRTISNAVRNSPNLRNMLRQIQSFHGKKRLIPLVDMPTRWSTLYYMLVRFDEIYSDLLDMCVLGAFDDRDITFPNHQQMQRLRAINKALGPTEKFIRLLEGEKYVTISAVPSRLNACKTRLNQMIQSEDIADVAVMLLERLNHRLGFILTQPNLSLCAAALDPRYGHLNFICNIQPDYLRNQVWDAVENLAHQYSDMQPTAQQQLPIGNIPNFDGGNEVNVIRNTLVTLRAFHEAALDDECLAKREPLAYYEEIFSTHRSARCLKPLIKAIFCIPASSAPSERVFSKGRLLLPRLRCNLDPELAESMIIISEYTTSEHYDFNFLLLNEFMVSEYGQGLYENEVWEGELW